MITVRAAALAAALWAAAIAAAQKPTAPPAPPPQDPGAALADSLAQRLSGELHVKTIVGEPLRVGSVTLIPILMIDINFGGGGVAAPGAGPGGYLMSGEARPLGFVAVTKKGTRFLTAGAAPVK